MKTMIQGTAYGNPGFEPIRTPVRRQKRGNSKTNPEAYCRLKKRGKKPKLMPKPVIARITMSN
jgi:hypothetical protein